MKKHFKLQTILLTLMTFVLVSCGYKPSAHYINNLFDEDVYVEVAVDRAEPENASFVKDEMNRLIYTRFKGRVVPEAKASNKIYVSYRGTSFIPLAYDDGYVTRYRVNTRVKFRMLTKKGELTRNISSIYEADIHASSLVSSTLRTEAIRRGLEKALDEFMAYVSVKGALSDDNK